MRVAGAASGPTAQWLVRKLTRAGGSTWAAASTSIAGPAGGWRGRVAMARISSRASQPPRATPAMTSRWKRWPEVAARSTAGSEPHLDRARLLLGGLEGLLVMEPEQAGEDVAREGAGGVVHAQHGVVVVLAGVGDLALGVVQLMLESDERGAGLEVRVALGHREEALQGLGQGVLGLGLGRRGLGADRSRPGRGDGLQGVALVGGVALDRLHQVGDEVVAALELHADLGPGVVHLVPAPDELVVHGDGQPREESREEDDYRDHHRRDDHVHTPPGQQALRSDSPPRPFALQWLGSGQVAERPHSRYSAR